MRHMPGLPMTAEYMERQQRVVRSCPQVSEAEESRWIAYDMHSTPAVELGTEGVAHIVLNRRDDARAWEVARLVAASPELLEALTELNQWALDDSGAAYPQGTFEIVQAAIKKAKGL